MDKSIKVFSKQDIEILEEKATYKGYFKIIKYRLRTRLFKGGWSNPFERELFERGDAVALLPYDPLRRQVVLIEQFRIGALRNSETPWILELIAGVRGPEETDEDTIRREAQEEAGLTFSDIIPIYKFLSTPGACSESVQLFCGRIDASLAGGIHGLPEEDEDIRVHVLDLNTAYGMVQSGVIHNAFTIVALQWLQLNEERINQQWLNTYGKTSIHS